MAPEQAGIAEASPRPVDHRADLFSLGCVLYEMATGRPAFGGPTVAAVLVCVATVTPPAPLAVVPTLPPALSDLIMALLAKRPEERQPQTARETAERLRALEAAPAAGQLEGAAPSLPERTLTLPPGRRAPWLVALSAAVLLATLGAVVVWSLPKETSRTDGGKGPPKDGRTAGDEEPLGSLIIDLGQGVKLELVRIEPGEFDIGATEEEIRTAEERDRGTRRLFEGELPRHRVRITKPFYLGKFPITQEQYSAVTGKSNPSIFSAEGAEIIYRERVRRLKTDRFPVENVSWLDAQEFCGFLNEKHLPQVPKSLRQAGYRFRLPTEAQWEYACRAKTTTPFHFGKVLNGKQANCDGTAPFGTTEKGPFLLRTTSVGEYPPNDWGLYDMHGNVYQWCEDAYDPTYYSKGDTENPFYQGKDGDPRVMRGGCWAGPSRNCRAADRGWNAADSRSMYSGCRAALRQD
jgi:formylglycine-generating enzyme required for sulfatase activity